VGGGTGSFFFLLCGPCGFISSSNSLTFCSLWMGNGVATFDYAILAPLPPLLGPSVRYFPLSSSLVLVPFFDIRFLDLGQPQWLPSREFCPPSTYNSYAFFPACLSQKQHPLTTETNVYPFPTPIWILPPLPRLVQQLNVQFTRVPPLSFFSTPGTFSWCGNPRPGGEIFEGSNTTTNIHPF